MRTNPPTFEATAEPMEVEDWLRDIERKLTLSRCNEAEKVNFATHQLKGTVAEWWENYRATHVSPNDINWEEFAEAFRTSRVPEGIIDMKRQEFTKLKQGKMTVSEYLSRFTHLSRYAKDEVNTHAKKICKFRTGLNPGIHLQLVAHDFSTFLVMINKALMLEDTRKELDENRKRKMPTQSHHGAGPSGFKGNQYQGNKSQYQQAPRYDGSA